MGVTVVLISCSYANQEFIRVGYYVSNGMPGADAADADGEANAALAAAAADAAAQSPSSLQRTILADAPRVTRFLINWSPQDAASGTAGVDSAAAGAAEAEAGQWEDDEEGDIGLDELGGGDEDESEDDENDGDMDLTAAGDAGGQQGGW